MKTTTKILFALAVALVLSGVAIATVTYRSAIPMGTAASWNAATGGDTSAVQGPWIDNTASTNLRYQVGGGGGTANYVPFCVPTTTGDVCSWNSVSGTWQRGAAGGTGNFSFVGNVADLVAAATMQLGSTNTTALLLSANGGSQTINVDGSNGVKLNSGTSFVQVGQGVSISPSLADGPGSILVDIRGQAVYQSAGATLIHAKAGTGEGELFYGLNSGVGQVNAGWGENIIADTGGLTAGKVAVWSGARKAQDAAASASLHTIAGVTVLGAAANSAGTLARRGRVLVNADAGIVAGDLVVTSGAVAGNVVTNNAAAAGAIVGRATEATSGTVAGKVIIDLTF